MKHRAIRGGGGGSSRGSKHSLGQKLRDVARPSAGPLDLLAAAEAVGEDQAFFRRFPHGGQQHSLTDGGGDIMRLLGEAERAGHAATALGRALGLSVQVLAQRHFRLEADHGMMVAMRLPARAASLQRLREAFTKPRDETADKSHTSTT